ncbi:TPA: hypothetical protein DCX16_04430 [bacterium]|nr:hypothetical protein [bacterium]
MKNSMVWPSYPALSIADYIIGFFIFFVSYSIYLFCLPSTVGFGDSGDFITSSYVLGIAHPSGYPLYMVLGHLFSYIPISNIGMKITLMSCIFSSVTSTILYFLIMKLSSSRVSSISASLSFSFSYTFFRVSVYSKTYAIYAFFVALLLLIMVLWQESKKTPKLKTKSYLYLFLFILGLSFTNHNLMATTIPGFALFYFLIEKKPFKDINKFILFFFLGLSLLLYLPVRAFQNPPIDWANPTSISRFIDCIMVKFAQKRMFDITLLKFFFIFGSHLLLTLKQFMFFGIISFFGLYWLYKRNKTFSLLLLAIITVNTIFSLAVYTDIKEEMVDYEAYHIPSFIALAVGFGVGLSFIIKKKNIVKFIVILIPLIVCLKYFYISNKSRFYFAYDYGRNLLLSLPKKSIIFTYTDHEFMTIWYLKHVEKRRQDVIQLNLYDLTTDWVVERVLRDYPEIKFTGDIKAHYLFKLENLVKNNIANFNIFYTFNEDIYNPGYKIAYRDSLSNYGVLFKVEPSGITKIYDFGYLIRGILDKKVHKDCFTKDILKIYGYGYGILGSKYIYTEPKRAKQLFENAIEFDPENESYKKGLEIATERSKDLNF